MVEMVTSIGIAFKETKHMKQINIAVCLFGQIRTGVYCAPAIKAAYDYVDGKTFNINLNGRIQECIINVDYFFWTKEGQTVGQFIGKTYEEQTGTVDLTDLEKLTEIYKPKLQGITKIENEPQLVQNNSLIEWNFGKPLMLGIVSAINLKQQHELSTGIRYDLCICQRFDVVTEPFSPIEKIIREHGITTEVLYFAWFSKFWEEDGAWGAGDFWFGGDSYSIDMMSANISQYLIDSTRSDIDLNESQQFLGPNVMLLNAAKRTNSLLKLLQGLNAGPVRPEADLTLDVMDKNTAKKHVKFYVDNHPGL